MDLRKNKIIRTSWFFKMRNEKSWLNEYWLTSALTALIGRNDDMEKSEIRIILWKLNEDIQ